MLRFLSWLIAAVVFGVVLSGLFHEPCRHAVFADTVGGFTVGVLHCLLHVYCLRETSKNGKALNYRRIKHIMIHDIRMDMVIGLLIGVVNAIMGMCGR